jgi:hypothetical protein
MHSPELLIISAVKALVEIAALSLVAQGLIGILSGAARQQNLFYRLFQIVTAPIIRIVRIITPRFIAEIYLGMLSFILMFWLWIALIYAKASVCHAQQLACYTS